jgi:hypothetical protein
MPAFERVSDFAAPEIVGAVTREMNAGREIERATVKVFWSDSARSIRWAP